MRPLTLLLLFGGVLLGRIASQEFSSGPLQLLDTATYIGIAFGLAWAWRSWARRAIEDRRRDALRRQGGRPARSGRKRNAVSTTTTTVSEDESQADPR